MACNRKQMSTSEETTCYIFIRGWSKPAPNCRNIRSKSIRCVNQCVKTDRWQSLMEITNKVNIVMPNTISARTVCRWLRFYGFTRRKICKTLTIQTENRHRREHWYKSKLRCTLDYKNVIFNDETQVVDSNDHVFVWRCPGEVWRPECLGLQIFCHVLGLYNLSRSRNYCRSSV